MDSTGMDGTGRAEGTVPGRQQRGHPAKRPPERAQQRCIGQHISFGPTSTCPLVQDGWRRTVGDARWCRTVGAEPLVMPVGAERLAQGRSSAMGREPRKSA